MVLNSDLPSWKVVHSDQSYIGSNDQVVSAHIYTDRLSLGLRKVYSLFDCTLKNRIFQIL